MESFETVQITRGTRSRTVELITEEIPLTIETKGSELATLLASPTHLENLVTGFLVTSGLIQDASAIRSLVIDHERFRVLAELDGIDEELPFKRVYTSGCGKGVIFHNPIDVIGRSPLLEGFTVEGESLFRLMKEFLKGSEEHKTTRGVHSAALASANDILVLRDDIGRHNAIDKTIGFGLSQGWTFGDKMILTTGRISSEILSKALRLRIPLIAAAGSPTNQAVKLARATNLTLAKLEKGGITAFSGDSRIV
jgi:FdhD protein